MPRSYSLLTPPLKGRVFRPWLWPAPADVAVANQPPLTPYKFRNGGLWQPSKFALQPPAADIALPNQPPLLPYAFRSGGFWQVQKFWLAPPAAEQAAPNAPVLKPYPFRSGGFWQVQKFSAWPQLADAVIVIPPPPPLPPPPPAKGGDFGHVISDTLVRPQWRPPWGWLLPEKDYEPVLFALLSAGAITEEEFTALLAAIRSN